MKARTRPVPRKQVNGPKMIWAATKVKDQIETLKREIETQLEQDALEHDQRVLIFWELGLLVSMMSFFATNDLDTDFDDYSVQPEAGAYSEAGLVTDLAAAAQLLQKAVDHEDCDKPSYHDAWLPIWLKTWRTVGGLQKTVRATTA